MPDDYYETLEVDRNASDQEIRRAYRRLARKCHPDVNPDDKDAEAKFKKLNEAYQILSDPQKRTQYDQFGKAAFDGTGFGGAGFEGFSFDDLFSGFGFGDIFDILSGQRPHSRRQNSPQPGADLRYDLEITLEEAAFGVKKKIEVPRHETCHACKGSGAKPGTSPEKCQNCGGSGQVRQVRSTMFGQMVNIGTCSSCQGTGQIIKEKCQACGGSGREQKTAKIDVKIPPGADDASYLRVGGQGEAGFKGGPSGDLYVVIHLLPHEIFDRHGNDLYCKTTISVSQAVLGSEIKVPTLKNPAKLKIPPGTQSHTVFRLRGQGIPDLHTKKSGDLLAKVVVEIPKKLSREQERLFKQFAKSAGFQPETKRGFFERLKEA